MSKKQSRKVAKRMSDEDFTMSFSLRRSTANRVEYMPRLTDNKRYVELADRMIETTNKKEMREIYKRLHSTESPADFIAMRHTPTLLSGLKYID